MNLYICGCGHPIYVHDVYPHLRCSATSENGFREPSWGGMKGGWAETDQARIDIWWSAGLSHLCFTGKLKIVGGTGML